MAATRQDIEMWLLHAKAKGASHMIVATDTFDWEDYPVFVMPGEDAATKVEELRSAPMSQVMECYNMALPVADQLAERRAFHL